MYSSQAGRNIYHASPACGLFGFIGILRVTRLIRNIWIIGVLKAIWVIRVTMFFSGAWPRLTPPSYYQSTIKYY